MCMKVKLFDKDKYYGEGMEAFFAENMNERISLVTEVVVPGEINPVRLKDMEDLLSYENDIDVYLLDISLYSMMAPIMDMKKTIVLKESSDFTKLENVYVIEKYQKPEGILNAIEELSEKLANEEKRINDIRNRLVSNIREKIDTDAATAGMRNVELRKRIKRLLYVEIESLKNTEQKIFNDEISDKEIAEGMRDEIVASIYSSIRGYGVLDVLLEDDSITEIMINNYDNIFIERDGRTVRFPGGFDSAEQFEDMIQKIVGRAGREVNQANPIVDTRLDDGSRVNVVLPPIALYGPTMTIRKFSKIPFSLNDLVGMRTISVEAANFLKTLVKARYNIFISGGTGSGKTTFLNALSNFIPKTERIITIEDSAELRIEGIDNLVSMETRNANATGSGEVPMRTLIKSSLRMRPDRIIVGEVRGIEALDMLQAMNTGHDGSLSTGHANSSIDMLSRLETMILQNSEGIPLAALRRQISSSIDIIIHLSRMMDHSRKVVEISEVMDIDAMGNVVLNPLFELREGKLIRTENPLHNTHKLQLAGF